MKFPGSIDGDWISHALLLGMSDDLTREIFGNVGRTSKLCFYVATVAASICCVWGVYRRVSVWRLGEPEQDRFQMRVAVRRFVSLVLTQRTVRGRGAASVAHALLFFGFVVLTLGTTLIAIEHYWHDLFGDGALHPVFHKGLYFVIFEISMETFGLALTGGLVWFLFRRLRGGTSIGHDTADWIVLGSMLFLCVSGYVIEGLRIILEQTPSPGISYVGYGFARLFETAGINDGSAPPLHLTLWWVHAYVALGLIAATPYCRLLHVIVGPLSIVTHQNTLGRLVPVTMEQLEATGRVGVGHVQEFSSRRLLELDACVSCGRCQDACPAFEAGKPLSPRDVVQDIRRHLNVVSPLLRSTRGREADDDDVASAVAPALQGGVITADTLWSCTTCNACADVCPVDVSPVTLITDMRRHLVGEGMLRGPAATALQKMQRLGNPWGLPTDERFDWADGLDVPTVTENPEFEVLYWIGCAASYDRRVQNVVRSVVKLLHRAGVNFAVLGNAERCTGESARRMGDEFLFQELAMTNIETLNRHGVKKILTHCPHCLNSLRQDYSQFDGHYEVVHHSTYLMQLVDAGKLPRPANDATDERGKVTYHDPCYLARVQGETQAPRRMVQLAHGAATNHVEPLRRESETACCGAGGGRMWFDDAPNQRIGRDRVKELLETDAQTVAVACPFCLTMVADGVAASRPDVQVKDIAELLVEALADETNRASPRL